MVKSQHYDEISPFDLRLRHFCRCASQRIYLVGRSRLPRPSTSGHDSDMRPSSGRPVKLPTKVKLTAAEQDLWRFSRHGSLPNELQIPHPFYSAELSVKIPGDERRTSNPSYQGIPSSVMRLRRARLDTSRCSATASRFGPNWSSESLISATSRSRALRTRELFSTSL